MLDVFDRINGRRQQRWFHRVRKKPGTLVIDKKDPLSGSEDIQWSEGQIEPDLYQK